jgi:ATP-dependent RNA helicase DDX23/PRP28
MISESARKAKLIDLLHKYPDPPIIIFVNLKADTEFLFEYLRDKGFRSATLHGNKTQDKREAAL